MIFCFNVLRILAEQGRMQVPEDFSALEVLCVFAVEVIPRAYIHSNKMKCWLLNMTFITLCS